MERKGYDAALRWRNPYFKATVFALFFEKVKRKQQKSSQQTS